MIARKQLNLLDSVANIAALSGVDTAGMADGVQVYVDTLRSFFTLSSVVGAADGITIVAASGSAKFWYRSEERSLTWATTASWYISAAGDDENQGDTSLAPLKTWAEFVRRVSVVSIAVTVTIRSDLAEPLIGFFESGSSTAYLTIQGDPVIDPAGLINTTTFANPSPAGNTRGTIASTNIADMTPYVGRIARITSGAETGAIAPILAANVATGYTPFWAKSDFTVGTVPPNNSSFEVLTLRTVPTIQISTNGLAMNVRFLRFTDTSFPNAAYISSLNSDGGWFFGCSFAGFITAFTDLYLVGCSFEATSGNFTGINSKIRLYGGGSVGASLFHNGVGSVIFYGFIVQGGSITIGNTSGNFASVSCVEVVGSTAGLGVFDAVGHSISVGSGARITGGTLYGTSPASGGYGLVVDSGGQVQFAAGLTPTITGQSGNLLFCGSGTAIVPPVAGSPIASSALTTWAQWEAAPFGRQVVNYGNLSKISAG